MSKPADELNNIIHDIQVTERLTAEARNALHGATLGHPWCAGKELEQRIAELRCVLAGRKIDGRLLHRIERVRV